MKGRKALTWTRGLKERFGILDKKERELFAEQDVEDTPIASVPRKWWPLLARRPSLRLRLLDVAERDGSEGVSRFFLRLWKTGRRPWEEQRRRTTYDADGSIHFE